MSDPAATDRTAQVEFAQFVVFHCLACTYVALFLAAPVRLLHISAAPWDDTAASLVFQIGLAQLIATPLFIAGVALFAYHRGHRGLAKIFCSDNNSLTSSSSYWSLALPSRPLHS